jgi:hypothetical protein
MGVHGIYRQASDILQNRGMSKTLTYDPYTKSVDIVGALLLACGASEKLLNKEEIDIEKYGVPKANIAKFLVGVEYLEAMIDSGLEDWCSMHETAQGVKLLRQLADRIDISVVRQPISG